MIRGIYTAASGMVAETDKNDAIANNLANAATVGYKKDIAITKNFHEELIYRINDGIPTVIGKVGTGSKVDEVATIHNEGPLKLTDNKLDLAITGKGFFVVDTPNGERYTRNGSFTLNAEGQLVTQDGNPVQGQGGPINIDVNDTINIAITTEGEVYANEILAGTLRVVDFENTKELAKEGAGLFRSVGGNPNDITPDIKQGILEQSNVNVISEMVNMITSYRAYEINSKAVQAQDGILDKAVNEVGRV